VDEDGTGSISVKAAYPCRAMRAKLTADN